MLHILKSEVMYALDNRQAADAYVSHPYLLFIIRLYFDIIARIIRGSASFQVRTFHIWTICRENMKSMSSVRDDCFNL